MAVVEGKLKGIVAQLLCRRAGIRASCAVCGQQQRVLLARALCAAGRLLLMDEPFTGLDPTVTNELYDVVDKLNHEQGVTVIMVTHDVPEALRHVSRILHLGAEHFDGTAEEYRQSPLYRRLMGGDSHA